MAKKKSRAKLKLKIKFNYDAPVTLTFTLLSVLLFVIDFIFLKERLNSSIFITPTVSGDFQFSFSSLNSYLRLFLYIFGRESTLLFFSRLVIITLLGPRMEERYGSAVIGIMILVSTFFTGVLFASCCKVSFNGSTPIVFMLILLDMLFHISKKTVSLSSALATALFIACLFINPNENGLVGILIVLAGGLCGSLFAFMASPKTRARKTVSKVENKNAEKSKSAEEPVVPESPATGSSDETVVGSIKF
ncbi:MAG: hypothetical protein K6G09_00540 [Treponema sp.]|nr:hypothetical protein [Treponema sp.]